MYNWKNLDGSQVSRGRFILKTNLNPLLTSQNFSLLWILGIHYGQKNHEKNLPNLNVGTGQCGVGGERQSSGAIACMYKLCFLSAPWRRKEGGPNDVVFMPKPQNVINLF